MIFLDEPGNMSYILKRVTITFMTGQEIVSERQG